MWKEVKKVRSTKNPVQQLDNILMDYFVLIFNSLKGKGLCNIHGPLEYNVDILDKLRSALVCLEDDLSRLDVEKLNQPEIRQQLIILRTNIVESYFEDGSLVELKSMKRYHSHFKAGIDNFCFWVFRVIKTSWKIKYDKLPQFAGASFKAFERSAIIA